MYAAVVHSFVEVRLFESSNHSQDIPEGLNHVSSLIFVFPIFFPVIEVYSMI